MKKQHIYYILEPQTPTEKDVVFDNNAHFDQEYYDEYSYNEYYSNWTILNNISENEHINIVNNSACNENIEPINKPKYMFVLRPGGLIKSKKDIIGTGKKFDKIISKNEILLFLGKEPYADVKNPYLWVFYYIQNEKKCCIICPEQIFRTQFEVIFYGNEEYNK